MSALSARHPITRVAELAAARPVAAVGPAADIHREIILVVDFGSQYTRLIARRVREAGVYCEIHPWHTAVEKLAELAPKAVILSGGPDSLAVSPAADAAALLQRIAELKLPLLGICYGMQLLAHSAGGEVSRAQRHEYGLATVGLCSASRLLDEELFGGQQLSVWMSHGDQVQSLPPDYQLLAASENAPIAAFKHVDREWYGLQFHPEVTHTEQGQQILHRFVRAIAGCSGQWTADNIVADTVARLRRQLGSERVLLALSGGVDSTVAAALLQQAVGRQLVCVFVDNGLLRENEVESVRSALTSALDSELHIVDAGERFFSALQGVTDPEHKRRVIGNLFIEVFEAEAARFGNIRFLAQGTIYPDRIESAGAGTPGQLIKSHHNVGGLPERMKMELIEPLSELFKDEVRSVGRQLGLPEQLIGRHPFPGPGLECGCWARFGRSMSSCCARRTVFLSPSCGRPAGTTVSVRPLRSFCRCIRSG